MIREFFSCQSFAVIGASTNRSKFGNKVLRKYIEKGLPVVPVHPKENQIEGVKVQQLAELAGQTKMEVLELDYLL